YGVSPNPMVGCVIVRDGNVIAEGWHRRAGEAHAEVDALSRCSDARGATMYVTLEPCSHHGRTPPCADAVIASGVERVVVAMADPNEIVAGRGIERLRAAGIEVTTGVSEAEARRLNEKYVWSISEKLPFVLLKAAMSADGKLATSGGESQWITGEDARQKSLALREEFDAILVGGGTIKTDNPRLTRRLGLGSTSWTRVVLDGDGDVPAHAQVFGDGARTLLFTSRPPVDGSQSVEVVPVEGRVDIRTVLGELYSRGVTSVIVEGGPVVLAEMLTRDLWQKMVLFVAPMFIGGGATHSIFGGSPATRLTDARRFRFDRVESVGRDLMITAYPG
ncbi:MAG TPA: bifunctional diaminohydroxyphosphoribosylaminopyrimidine deaminase/5-amino-6-(5-phosphoribosylamino)uracil reductase RibD, partial [Thermoanaerobaculia bacterium]